MKAKELKYKELMLKDWVMRPSGKPVQLGPVTLEYIYRGYKVFPMELTSDMISKNIDNCHWNRANFIECFAVDGELSIAIFYYGRIKIHVNYGKNFEWKSERLYVHELQHVLRKCGLNELANNFKI